MLHILYVLYIRLRGPNIYYIIFKYLIYQAEIFRDNLVVTRRGRQHTVIMLSLILHGCIRLSVTRVVV